MQQATTSIAGKTIAMIVGLEAGSDKVVFDCSDGSRFRMMHDQDCCESVEVNEVIGDINDLFNSPILAYEESVSDASDHPDVYDSGTWTFYHLRTVKGAVTIRWLGTSNGYYSESVDFEQLSAEG